MNDNKDKKDIRHEGQNLQQALFYQAHRQYFLSDSLLKWNELLKEAADTRHHQERH